MHIDETPGHILSTISENCCDTDTVFGETCERGVNVPGAIKYLLQHYEADKIQFVGASAGALVATIAACRVDPEAAVECAYR